MGHNEIITLVIIIIIILFVILFSSFVFHLSLLVGNQETPRN
ncbi:hypothetical protein P344_02480 [Spiroplasma mirum ATCC 29335]|uniref:Uncharacterized protein n=1 Tax=Spiroplasma mirum ATCC 29335 TaxID=838561 RepID=W6AKK9_9MOLU|nr:MULTISPECIES: hypothetical protein [Spiroplasma]AHI57843.1 hypothetical protein P344_02480 [Spiroplasma mirum ATCC 29335]